MEFSALPEVVLRVFGGFPALAVFYTVFALAFDLMKRWKKCDNYPPGPRALPFLGNLLQVDLHNPHLSFAKLRKKYGDVMSLDFGWTNVVVLSGYKALKEALVKKSEDFADRPELPMYEKIFKRFGEVTPLISLTYRRNALLPTAGGERGSQPALQRADSGIILAKYGDGWKAQRKFALSTLKNLGLGKKSLERRILEEAGFLHQAFEGEQGGPFDPHILLTYANSNIICSIIFGDRFEYHDEWFLGFLHILEESLVLEGGFWGQLTNAFPFVRQLPGPQQKIFENQNKITQFLQKIVTRHKESWDPDDPRDFIDAFFTQQEKMKHIPNTSFQEPQLVGTLWSLFTAGTETTSTTLNWALLFMVLHPDVQAQVHEEIDRVIGNRRKPKLEDREEMPFTNAVIHETQRLGNIVPISLPHETYRDTEVMGYTIPKGTTIFPNITSVLYDEDIWLTPCEFNPGHFLNSDGMFVKPEAFIPFSAGHRVCLGEQLAKTELFIFFTSMLQHFTFFLPENEPRPNFREAKYGVTLCPPPYRLCVKTR